MPPAGNPKPSTPFVPRLETRETPPSFRAAISRGDSYGVKLVPISPLGIISYSYLYNTQEDIKNILFVKVQRGV